MERERERERKRVTIDTGDCMIQFTFFTIHNPIEFVSLPAFSSTRCTFCFFNCKLSHLHHPNKEDAHSKPHTLSLSSICGHVLILCLLLLLLSLRIRRASLTFSLSLSPFSRTQRIKTIVRVSQYFNRITVRMESRK